MLAMIYDILSTKIPTLRSDIEIWSIFVEASRKTWGNRWALCTLSVYVAETVDINDHQSYDIFDDQAPLCHRTIWAKKSARNIEWWRSQIVKERFSNTLYSQLVILCALKWMPIENVLEFSDIISNALDEMDNTSWNNLASAVSVISNLSIRRRRNGLHSITKRDMPTSMSVRLASLISYRVKSASAQIIFHHYLENYDGRDNAVLLAITKILADSIAKKPELWTRALPVIAHAYKNGVSFPFMHHGSNNLKKIPMDIARSICVNPDEYPLHVVGQAEAILASKTGADAVPVGKIAARDNWFTDE
ncbi:hypothetical protein M5E06_11020 [Azospirillum sp. A1-3]|uniref:hypothetical protein n=1 Tax=Azospirillum sp. A1-3 TaxID=185874 RepID=UPI0020777255|nr:hypothetical protein [Azospirillum sp. A1-3]MCM8734721.1 hypothetical protein [Azospirillum sp. A1-3]